MSKKLEDFNQIWQDVNDVFSQVRKYPELNELSYFLSDFRDYMSDIIDDLEASEEGE